MPLPENDSNKKDFSEDLIIPGLPRPQDVGLTTPKPLRDEMNKHFERLVDRSASTED